MAYIEVDSKKIYTEEYGKSNSRTIIIFHGGPAASCRGFENLAEALSDKYHVICFDQCGVSRSDAIHEDEPFGMTEHIKQIDKMREVFNVSSWTIMGHSYGGMLACLYAHTYPQNTEAVIYVGAAWDFGLSARAQAAYLIPYFSRINSQEGLQNCIELINNKLGTTKEIRDFFMSFVVPLVKDFRELCFYHKSVDEMENIPTREYNTPPEPENARQKSLVHIQKLRVGGEVYDNYYPYLNKIDKPSLFIVGKYDPLGGQYERDCFLKNAPKGKVVELNNSGHFPHKEEPQLFTIAVIDFMDSLYN